MRSVLIENPLQYWVYNTDTGARDYVVKYSLNEAEKLRDKLNDKAGYAKFDIMTYQHYKDRDKDERGRK